VAGKLGYCVADRMHAVVTGDEIRDCWREAAPVAEPFQGLFGEPGTTHARLEHAPAVAPAVAPPVASLAAPSSGMSRVPGATTAPAPPASTAWDRASSDRLTAPDSTATRPEGGAPGPRVIGGPTPFTPDDRVPRGPGDRTLTIRDDDPALTRSSGLALLPATLANRLRQRLSPRAERGWRAVPVHDDAVARVPVGPGTSPEVQSGRPGNAGRPGVVGRPGVIGGLVEAPPVAPSGTITSLGDQLRRAEQVRRERSLPDLERLRRDRGGDPLA
jgi:hypothetical protein